MTSRIGGRRWWRDPVVHFAVLGACLFALQRWIAPPTATQHIVLSAPVLRGLYDEHARRTGMAPTPQEEAALIERYVSDEILYREALAQGLDRGDIIVRRRLVQKMQFLLESLAPLSEPTEKDLRDFLQTHRDRYAVPERVSLTHVFVRADRPGGDVAHRAAEIRERLRMGEDPSTLGDPFLHGRTLTLRTHKDIAGIFGAPFVDQIAALPVGQWVAPITSSFGVHVVQLTQRESARLPALDEVRDSVRRDWQDNRRTELNQLAMQELRRRYDVQVDPSVPAQVATRP